MHRIIFAAMALLLVACAAPAEPLEWSIDPANIRPPRTPDPWLAPVLVSDEAVMRVAVEAHFSDPVHDLGWTSEYIPPPTPTATPRPAPLAKPSAVSVSAAGGQVYPAGTDGDVAALIRQYPWPHEQAIAVAFCESGMRNVQNGAGGPYYGPFQLWSGHFRAGEDMWNVADNVAVAYRVWSGSGWGPWECKP